jgi:hypothetical protein
MRRYRTYSVINWTLNRLLDVHKINYQIFLSLPPTFSQNPILNFSKISGFLWMDAGRKWIKYYVFQNCHRCFYFMLTPKNNGLCKDCEFYFTRLKASWSSLNLFSDIRLRFVPFWEDICDTWGKYNNESDERITQCSVTSIRISVNLWCILLR